MWVKLLAYKIEGPHLFTLWFQGKNGQPIKTSLNLNLTPVGQMHDIIDDEVPLIEYEEDIYLVIEWHKFRVTHSKTLATTKEQQEIVKLRRDFTEFKRAKFITEVITREEQLKHIVEFLPQDKN